MCIDWHLQNPNLTQDVIDMLNSTKLWAINYPDQCLYKLIESFTEPEIDPEIGA
jgi:hypothetical protein